MRDDERYQWAKARVDQLRGFYVHAAAFVVVNILLIAINLLSSPTILWVVWPLLGWGIGLAGHAVLVYAVASRWGRDWEERKIRELIERDRAH